jgi:hypothetical protein
MAADTWTERAANIAIVVTCATFLSILVARHHSPVEQPNVFTVGQTLRVGFDVPYSEARHTMVMFIRSTCHFCTASMPFFRSIGALPGRKARRLKIVAVSPEPASVTEAYLAQHDVEVDQVSQSAEAVGTPTLVLVDSNGIVNAVWVGQQDEAGQDRIVQVLSAD